MKGLGLGGFLRFRVYRHGGKSEIPIPLAVSDSFVEQHRWLCMYVHIYIYIYIYIFFFIYLFVYVFTYLYVPMYLYLYNI